MEENPDRTITQTEVTRHDRYLEWKALYDYAYENWQELETKGRALAVTLCLQDRWKLWHEEM